MNEPVLEIKNLTKSYQANTPVLSSLSLTVPQGKIIGLLGPNGCGKSTLLKLISGILVPDSGEIYISGQKQSEETNSFISYLPERPYFSGRMKINELLQFFSDFYSDFDSDLARKMLADLNITENVALKTLSKGTKEKVQLVLVMSRRAKLYMLDEPIGGVDPAARDYILGTIINSYNPDASVLITTHLISDIEPALDEFMFMGYGGQIIMQGDAEDARENSGKSLDELFREVFRCSRSY